MSSKPEPKPWQRQRRCSLCGGPLRSKGEWPGPPRRCLACVVRTREERQADQVAV